jgi:transcriptional regulator with XRE-family HTH domain
MLRGELRLAARLTQEALGDRLGTDATFVSRIERGQRGVRWATLLRILRALDVSFGEFAAAVERHQARTK